MSVDIIPDFVKYQIEWLTSHKDLEFEPVIEDAIVQMLKDTGESFIDEQPDETSQFDHIADSDRKVSISCAHENDLISREAAIEAIAKQMPRSYTPDGSHPADEEIFKAQEIYVDCIESIEILPAVQPDLSGYSDRLWKSAYERGKAEAQPEEDWTLCSKRLPEEHEWIGTKTFGTTISDEVYVTFESQKGERFTKHLNFQNGKVSSFTQREIDVFYKDAVPIAWMPLPEPYKGGGTE